MGNRLSSRKKTGKETPKTEKNKRLVFMFADGELRISDVNMTTLTATIHRSMYQTPVDIEFLRKNLLSHPDAPKCVDPTTGDQPLHVAAKLGLIKAMTLLIDLKVDVNAVNKDGDTPLHYAVGFHHFECAVKLRTCGANDKKVNNAGFSAYKGHTGKSSYGIAAIISATTVTQLDIALSICETISVDDMDLTEFQNARTYSLNILQDSWTAFQLEKYNTIERNLRIHTFHKNKQEMERKLKEQEEALIGPDAGIGKSTDAVPSDAIDTQDEISSVGGTKKKAKAKTKTKKLLCQCTNCNTMIDINFNYCCECGAPNKNKPHK